jgi:uncharacterized protein (TIGR02996 family)
VTERDALLAAIRANPDDDTPRLMFADWLDEHEPDAKPRKGKGAVSPSSWAALIRAECEFERLKNDGSAAAAVFAFFSTKDTQALDGVRWGRTDPDVARRVEMFRTAERLRGRSAKARNAGRPTAGRLGVRWQEETHRGFPDGVKVNKPGAFAARAAELAEACPAMSVTLHEAGELPPDLGRRGLLCWCRELRIDGEYAEVVRAMSREPDAARVRSLTVWPRDGADADTVAATLADSPNWSGLRELQIGTGGGLSAGAAERLFGAKHLRGLTHLELSGRGWTATTLSALGSLPSLQSLIVRGSGLDDAAAESLANSPALAGLRYLDLESNRITGRGATALLASPHLKGLAVLDLQGNAVRGIDPVALAGAPAGGLRVLDLHGNRLSLKDITALTTSPRLSELAYFDADENRLADSAVARLVWGFGGRAPAILYLGSNNITTPGAEALANWPAAEQIDMLHLFNNRLPTAAAKAIAACPHLKGLTHFCASVSHSAGRAALKKRFGKRAFV